MGLDHGKPQQNVVIESFNGGLRDVLLNEDIFDTLDDARRKLRAPRRAGTEDTLWIREGYLDRDHDYRKLAVHGHTALDYPQHFGNGIDLDGVRDAVTQ